MSNLTMLIYTVFDGIESTVTWKSEQEYRLIVDFLQHKGVRVSSIVGNGASVGRNFVYIDSEQQLDDLDKYVQSLREKGIT